MGTSGTESCEGSVDSIQAPTSTTRTQIECTATASGCLSSLMFHLSDAVPSIRTLQKLCN